MNALAIPELAVTQHESAIDIDGTQVVSGFIPNARIQASGVTQHHADLEAIMDHDLLQNVDTNQHIDWTAATDNLVTSGTVQAPTLQGGTAVSGNLALVTTTDATKGNVTIDGHALTITAAADLDAIAVNTAKGSADASVTTHNDVTDAGSGAIITSAERTKIGHLTVTQAVDLDTMESDVTANTAKVSADGSVTTHNDVTDAGSGAIITSAERTKLSGIEELADVTDTANVTSAGAAMLAGQPGGQTLNGGTLLSDDLVLSSTSNATKGEVIVDSIPLKRTLLDEVSTGLLDGGELSINADTTKFDVALGNGVIIDSYTDTNNPVYTSVTWGNLTAIDVDNIATHPSTHIYIDSSGNVLQNTSKPTPDLRRDNIYLGKLVHEDNVNVTIASNQPEFNTNIGNALHDYWRELGMIVVSGNRVTPNGANLKIDKSAGRVHQSGVNYSIDKKHPNIKDLTGSSPATFAMRTQTGVETALITDLVVDTYDQSGTPQVIAGSGNQATNIRVYLFNSNNIRIQYGQQVYATLSDAVSGLSSEDFAKESNIDDNATLIAVISVIISCTDLSNSAECKISAASIFGEVGVGSHSGSISTLQNVYDNSTPKELVVDSNWAVIIKDNSTPIGANLLEVNSNDNATKYLGVDANWCNHLGLCSGRNSSRWNLFWW